MFSFNPLWKTLIDKNINKTKLQKMIECSPRTLAAMGKDEYVAMSILNKICKVLNCKIEEVIEYVDK